MGKPLILPGSADGWMGWSFRRTQKRLVAPAPPPQTPKGGRTARSASTESWLADA